MSGEMSLQQLGATVVRLLLAKDIPSDMTVPVTRGLDPEESLPGEAMRLWHLQNLVMYTGQYVCPLYISNTTEVVSLRECFLQLGGSSFQFFTYRVADLVQDGVPMDTIYTTLQEMEHGLEGSS